MNIRKKGQLPKPLEVCALYTIHTVFIHYFYVLVLHKLNDMIHELEKGVDPEQLQQIKECLPYFSYCFKKSMSYVLSQFLLILLWNNLVFTNSSEIFLAYIAVPNFLATSNATVLPFLNEHKTKMYLI